MRCDGKKKFNKLEKTNESAKALILPYCNNNNSLLLEVEIDNDENESITF